MQSDLCQIWLCVTSAPVNQPRFQGFFVGSIPGRIGRLIIWLLCCATATTRSEPARQFAADFFPIGVWLQHPTNAARYQAAGINTYVSLWQGPTTDQLTALQPTGVRLVCAPTQAAQNHPYRSNIIAWLHEDEPDNTRQRGARLGFGSPTTPAELAAQYRRMKTADPTRPVLLILGQGVAWDNWYGRGNRNRHPEDYPAYLQSCDIAAFDIYPVNHTDVEVAGQLWYVARGVQRLRQWTADAKPVWNTVECTTIDLPDRKPTPHEVRAQVWMSLIHGSRGIIYFCHQFQPVFREAALLDDPEMLAAVTALNRQITALAAVLHRPTATNLVTVRSHNPALPIATMTKRHNGEIYLFAVAMRPLTGSVSFNVSAAPNARRVEVLGENRFLTLTNGSFDDEFKPWEVHLYCLPDAATRN